MVVGVHRTGGVRGLPVNAELDFDRVNSAIGRAQRTLLPGPSRPTTSTPKARRRRDDETIGLTRSVAAPVLRHGEAWGALVASAAEEEALPPGCEQRLVGARRAARRRRWPTPTRGPSSPPRARRLVEAGDEVAPPARARAARGRAPARRRARAQAARRAAGAPMPGSEEEELLRRRARRRDGGERRAGRAGARPASRRALRARARRRAAGARGALARCPCTCASCPAGASRRWSRRRRT